MFSSEQSNNLRWQNGHQGRKFLGRQWRRLALGCLAGSVISIGVHLLTRDSHVVPVWRQQWTRLANNNRFDGAQAYQGELVTLCLSLLVIVAVPSLVWVTKCIRGWWAGMTSFSIPVTACVTVAALEYGRDYPETIAVVGSAFFIAIFVTEHWRQRSEPPEQSVLDLNIPTTNQRASGVHPWEPRTSDDPIHDWEEDIIGRGPVVQLLALHSLFLRTPIVALIGGLGDGKSSVLNLLRKTIEGHAIVVSFSAWLPGSEVTLATDLFHDIVAECAKHVHVPQLRKRALTFARMVSASVPYLAGARGELFRPESQREEVQGLREVLARVPKRIVVLLDEIDRMQKEELMVLLKILRGASSIPNVTFVCAFSDEEIKRVLKDGGISWEYLEKFFPVSVRLSAPDVGWLGTSFQTRLKDWTLSGAWLKTDQEAKKFAELLEQIWRDSLSKVCTNLRKAGILCYDIITAGRSIVGDADLPEKNRQTWAVLAARLT